MILYCDCCDCVIQFILLEKNILETIILIFIIIMNNFEKSTISLCKLFITFLNINYNN